MDSEAFRRRGRDMIDYICTYLEEIGERRVTPSVEPGYLRRLIPDDPPEQPETWEEIMRDVETKIMPGVTHWQHPRFHAYFPSGNSFPSILGDMLSGAIGCIGFSWVSCWHTCAERLHPECHIRPVWNSFTREIIGMSWMFCFVQQRGAK